MLIYPSDKETQVSSIPLTCYVAAYSGFTCTFNSEFNANGSQKLAMMKC